jgi:hypothetical protein
MTTLKAIKRAVSSRLIEGTALAKGANRVHSTNHSNRIKYVEVDKAMDPSQNALQI